MDARYEPLEVNGKKCYTVKQFAFLTNKTTATIYNLITKGNAIRRLRIERLENKPMIPIEELTEFPFVLPGPHGKDYPYFYDANGRVVETANEQDETEIQ